MVRPCSKLTEGRLPKLALKWMPKRKGTRGRPKKYWMEGIRKAMNERNLNEGQWGDRKRWSLGVGHRRKKFLNLHTLLLLLLFLLSMLLISVRGCVNPRPICGRKDYANEKFQ